jgi:hypothetical protein
MRANSVLSTKEVMRALGNTVREMNEEAERAQKRDKDRIDVLEARNQKLNKKVDVLQARVAELETYGGSDDVERVPEEEPWEESGRAPDTGRSGRGRWKRAREPNPSQWRGQDPEGMREDKASSSRFNDQFWPGMVKAKQKGNWENWQKAWHWLRRNKLRNWQWFQIPNKQARVFTDELEIVNFEKFMAKGSRETRRFKSEYVPGIAERVWAHESTIANMWWECACEEGISVEELSAQEKKSGKLPSLSIIDLVQQNREWAARESTSRRPRKRGYRPGARAAGNRGGVAATWRRGGWRQEGVWERESATRAAATELPAAAAAATVTSPPPTRPAIPERPDSAEQPRAAVRQKFRSDRDMTVSDSDN